MDEFPGNSHTARRIEIDREPAKPEASSSQPKKQVAKVVDGRVSQQKKTLGSRMARMFLNEGTNLREHIIENVMVPMVKDMALNIVTQIGEAFRAGVEEAIYGESRPRSRTSSYGSSRSPVNYTRFSTSPSRRPGEHRPGPPGSIRRSNVIKRVVVETREEGEDVLEELNALLHGVGHCTVGDFYSLVGLTPRSTDEEWGWLDLKLARVHQLDRDEFLIKMPAPHPIET